MSTSLILIILLIVGAGAYGLAASRAVRMSGGKLSALHSRPGYYGAYAAIWAILLAGRQPDDRRAHRARRLSR